MHFAYHPSSIFKTKFDYIQRVLIDAGWAFKMIPVLLLLSVSIAFVFFLAGARNNEITLLCILFTSFYFFIQFCVFIKALLSWDLEIVFENGHLLYGPNKIKAKRIVKLKERGDCFYIQIQTFLGQKFFYFVFPDKQQKEEFMLKAREFVEKNS